MHIQAAENGIGSRKWAYNDIRSQELLADLVIQLRRIPQPVIAVIEGAAVGAGLAIACASDIRIGTESAVFSAGFSRLGLSGTDMGVSFLLPKIVGQGKQSEMMLTGCTIDASSAIKCGLINCISDKPFVEARKYADKMLQGSFWGLHLTKRQLNVSAGDIGLQAAITSENSHQMYLMNRQDVIITAKAWLDRLQKQNKSMKRQVSKL